MSKSKDLIEEIIHATFTKVYERLMRKDFQLQSTLEAYFMQSCKYALYHKTKENQWTDIDAKKIESQLSTAQPKEYISSEKQQFFKQKILPALNNRERQILELAYEGCSNEVIAEKLDNTVASIKAAKSKALRKAKAIAKEQFPDFF